jgi:exodeoxyribonuclease-5
MEANTLNWSPKQQAALADVRSWLDGWDTGRDKRQCFYLAGYAGSGKTTLAREFALGTGRHVEFGAYTGKAALVLQKKGCPDAKTIHSLIYVPVVKSKVKLLDLQEEFTAAKDRGDEDAMRDLQAEIEEEQRKLKAPSFALNEGNSILLDADLVVIDECSMVDDRMGEDLLRFGKPILVLGDPAQLPPVGKGTGFFTSREPDFMLDEIHRQAAGSPVLQLATKVRNGSSSLDLGDYGGGTRVLPKKGVTIAEAVEDFDQILCGKNETRRAINREIRRHLGYEGDLPVPGDKLICLRNDKESGLLNGSFWVVADSKVEEDGDTLRLVLRDPDDADAPAKIEMAHRHHFEGRELPWFKARDAQEFDYGYAITCHKSQGSQWNRVLIYDQSACFRQDRRKWLYTAITRAAESVTIVRM